MKFFKCFTVATLFLLIVIGHYATLSQPTYALFFGHSTNISNTNESSTDPQIVTSGKSNVYVVWSDTTTGNGDIYFKASTDNGTTFSKTKNLINTNESSTDPQIATSGKSNVYVVWSDTTTGNGDIYFKSSTDNGTTFSKTKKLSNDTGSSTDPRIAVSGKSNVYMVWRNSTSNN